jgi:hypothetical protein
MRCPVRPQSNESEGQASHSSMYLPAADLHINECICLNLDRKARAHRHPHRQLPEPSRTTSGVLCQEFRRGSIWQKRYSELHRSAGTSKLPQPKLNVLTVWQPMLVEAE